MPQILDPEIFPHGTSVLEAFESRAIPSSLFDYHSDTRTLVAEMSDLGARQFHMVYNDAVDVGLTVRSMRTGELMVFVITDREYIGDGENSELAATILKSVSKTKAGNPRVKMVLYND